MSDIETIVSDLKNAHWLLADEITRLRADLAAVTAERDALAACLEPVDDETLVEIAAYFFNDGSSWSALSERLRNTCCRDARNVIAAIRPHIEAAERERIKSKLREIDTASRMGGIFTLDSIIAEIDAPQQSGAGNE